MKIIYTDEFVRKSSIPHYPMKGYWAQLGQKSEGKSWFYQWSLINSSLYSCNTFLMDDQCRISITIDNHNDQVNTTNYIYLFALDQLMYTDIAVDFDGPKDPKLFSQLAAIIDFEIQDNGTDVINKTVTNIFDIGYLPKCSFNCIAGNKQVQVEHYNSENVGKSNFYDDNLQDRQFIDKESGLDKVRETLSYYKPSELLGTMTIKKSGLIQL